MKPFIVLGLESTGIEDIWAIEMEWSDRREMIGRKYASNLIGANAEIIIAISDFSYTLSALKTKMEKLSPNL
jgi:hypothetical protein